MIFLGNAGYAIDGSCCGLDICRYRDICICPKVFGPKGSRQQYAEFSLVEWLITSACSRQTWPSRLVLLLAGLPVFSGLGKKTFAHSKDFKRGSGKSKK